MTGSVASRLLISGTGSDCGKTTVVSAILRVWQRRGTALAAFKCGPDYIDPMFHTAVLQVPCRNLDLFFVDEQTACADMARHIPRNGVGVIEGAMGFYDGVSGDTTQASAAHLAQATGTPVILVVRPRGQSLSLAAALHGFRTFAPNTIRGVILNGISQKMYPFYRAIIEKAGLRTYGYLPYCPGAAIPDRHLGLVTAAEITDLSRKLDRLADAAETALDLNGLLALARTAKPLQTEQINRAPVRPQVRIAMAQDQAFCFYYQDNLDVLQELGAELIPFSPLREPHLPDDIHGLYLGGGYPELYAAELSANQTMRASVRQAIVNNMPVIAECGGFQYLHESLDGYPMAGVFPFAARMTGQRQPFGYVTLTAQRDSLLCRAGESVRAHEFHYGVSDDNGDAFLATKPNGQSWPCVHATDTMYAGYPHLYFRSSRTLAARFIQKIKINQNKTEIK